MAWSFVFGKCWWDVGQVLIAMKLRLGMGVREFGEWKGLENMFNGVFWCQRNRCWVYQDANQCKSNRRFQFYSLNVSSCFMFQCFVEWSLRHENLYALLECPSTKYPFVCFWWPLVDRIARLVNLWFEETVHWKPWLKMLSIHSESYFLSMRFINKINWSKTNVFFWIRS